VKDVKPGWHDKLFNGSFLHQNVYRGAAGPEVDAAWTALGVNCEPPLVEAPDQHWLYPPDRSVLIPPEEAEETGFRHDQVKVTEKYGGGFPANVEGLHHLHCLVSSTQNE
jgi:hypothetical protein